MFRVLAVWGFRHWDLESLDPNRERGQSELHLAGALLW